MNRTGVQTPPPLAIPEGYGIIPRTELERANDSLKKYTLPEEERLALIAKDPPRMPYKPRAGIAFVPKRKGGKGA